ncbi:hypothetical protein [Paenibacillus terrigena]|uniref:hypothetical protein n=1 Tax=Paenibacillus terrigena TaxID=369333 RepID=UPI0028D4C4D0|nr:hypothetical protein [Paenibacillus terrigena]
MDISVDFGVLIWSMIAVAAVLVGYFYLQSPVEIPIRTIVIEAFQSYAGHQAIQEQRMVLRLGWIRRKIPSRKPRKKPADDELHSAIGVQDRTRLTPIGGQSYVILVFTDYIRIQHFAHRTLPAYA